MYLIDANVLMTAADYHYPQDVVPGFWEQIIAMLEAGEAVIPESVYKELTVYEQKWTAGWVRDKVLPQHRLIEDNDQILKLKEITNWMVRDRQPSFSSHELNRFFAGADPKIIAADAVKDCAIVTYEKPVKDPLSKKAKIPDIAARFGVTCITPIEMLREAGRQI